MSEATYSVHNIDQLPYADFIALIGQPNSPPGGEIAIRDWIDMAGVDVHSLLLDLACSTGFSSRTIVRQVGCKAVGIDVSGLAIAQARRQAECESLAERLCYLTADAACLPFERRSFSHVIAGSSFGFIAERSQALAECARVLNDQGSLCVAIFYYKSPPPPRLLTEIAACIGYTPSPEHDYTYWYDFFSRSFALQNQREYVLAVQPETEVSASVRAFVYADSSPLSKYGPNVRKACFERLRAARLVLNKHRRYQGIAVMRWRKTDD